MRKTTNIEDFYNLRLAEIDGVVQNFAESKAQVLGELDQFQADPSFEVSDITKVVLGDELLATKKVRGQAERVLIPERVELDLKTDKWKEFWEANKPGTEASPKPGSLERSLKTIDFDRILAAADNVDGSTNFGQRGAQRGLNFTVVPEGF